MRKDLIVPGEIDELAGGGRDPRISLEAFSPLLTRIEQEQPDLLPALLKLKELIGEENFDKYINSLQNIRRNDTTVILITGDALAKTNIEGRFLSQAEAAFGVNFVRVVCL